MELTQQWRQWRWKQGFRNSQFTYSDLSHDYLNPLTKLSRNKGTGQQWCSPFERERRICCRAGRIFLTTANRVISSWWFADKGKEMYKYFNYTCRVIVLFIKPIVFLTFILPLESRSVPRMQSPRVRPCHARIAPNAARADEVSVGILTKLNCISISDTILTICMSTIVCE